LTELFYSTGIKLYSLLATAASPFVPKARLWVSGRKGLLQQLRVAFKDNSAPVAWFHCASLGEFEQARPVIEGFKASFPTFKILLTFFSPSGYTIRKNTALADWVFYLPADTPNNARQFLDISKPAIAFFVKYEFWHNYTLALQQRNIPALSFSAIFRENQLFFKPYGGFYKKILSRFNHIFVQNETSAQLLQKNGLQDKASVVGDTRFDRVRAIVDARKEINEAKIFKNRQPLLVIGSSWPEDMALLIPFINDFKYPLKVIIAPHEIKESDLKDIETKLQVKSVRFSKASEEALKEASVLLIDNIGMLSSLYGYGDFAWIGGAFGKGLHNTLEAATYGLPVFFGPEYSKFQEAKDLVALEAAFPVHNLKEFNILFRELYLEIDLHEQVSDRARQYVLEQSGATSRIMQYVKTIIK
jgi:3-deoxy-D-manno-octulosonic-acid transferase